MHIRPLHSWDLTAAEAVAIQRQLAGRLELDTPPATCEFIAGADVSYQRFSETLYAGVVVLRTSDLAVVEEQGVVSKARFPYVPGLLSFREAPALLEAFALVRTRPDVVMLDGQGLAHPRRFGLACHIGLWLDVPCLGCAKSRLIGEYREPGPARGARAALKADGETIGKVVRTKRAVRPVFVSAGHKLDLETAIRLVLSTCRGYRLPEPTRQAHQFVNELRKNATCR